MGMGTMDMGQLGGIQMGGAPMPPMPGAEQLPQNKGFGIGAPGYFEPYQSSPGIQAPQGYGGPGGGGDFTQRGIGENMFGALGDGYTRPGMSEGYSAQQLNKYGASGTPGVANNQQQNFNQYQANKPDIGTDAGLDPYYDRARERQSATLDNQLAARGLSTSSGGVGLISDAMKDLNAEQANREADFKLRSLGEQRAWEGLGGQLAQGADQQSDAASANELNWVNGLGGLAANADNAGMYRLNSGMNAANQAQQLEQGRWQQLMNNEMGMADRQSGLMGQEYGNMLGDDQQLLDQSLGMDLGLGAEALNQDYRTQQKHKDDGQWGMDMFQGIMGMAGGI